MLHYFEDLEVGLIRRSSAVSLSEKEIMGFAKKYDPQYFHTDAIAAKASSFGGLVASGTHSIAHWSCLNNEICDGVQWICGIGFDELRFMKGLRPDVPVYATSQCVEKRLSKTDPSRGVVVFRSELVEESGDVIISFLNTNLVKTRHKKP